MAVLIITLAVITGCAGHNDLRHDHQRAPDDTRGQARISDTWDAPPHGEWDPFSGINPITVIYPRGPNDTLYIGGVLDGLPPDSLFVLGHVADPTGELIVQHTGAHVPVHPDGGFLAWLPRDEVTTTILSDTVRVRTTAVTFAYTAASNKQNTAATLTVQFADTVRTSTAELDPWPFVADTARLVVTAERAKLRIGWPGTNTMSPPVGTALIATGRVHGSRVMWRVPLGGGQVGWIAEWEVERDSGWSPAFAREANGGDILPRPRVIYHVASEVDGRDAHITVPVGEMLVHDVQRLDDHRLRLTLYGAVSWTDLVIQPHGSRAVSEVRWTQLDSTTWALDAFIDPAWFWGWETEWQDGGKLAWTIRSAPELDHRKPLRGVRVFVDPGHGGSNYSAIGPTGYPEKTANLELSGPVAEQLRKAGAEVILSREDDVYLGLAERVDLARELEADVIVSLHHNALAQGVNPAGRHGASVHYVHRHAQPLADAIYDAILAGGWPGNGLRYQDLALAGPSFCPAVLLEAGFMLHPGEEAVIRSDSYRNDMARWLTQGLEDYLARLAAAQAATR